MENTRILAEGELLPNHIYSPINRNDLIIGSTGAGKTRSYVIPNLIHAAKIGEESMIVTDTKGEIRKLLTNYLSSMGYRVFDIDFTNMSSSPHGYNPFDFIQSDEDIRTLSRALIQNECGDEPFWDNAVRQLFSLLVSAADYGKDIFRVPFTPAGISELFEDFMASPDYFQAMLNQVDEKVPDAHLFRKFRAFSSMARADKTWSCITGMLNERLYRYSGSDQEIFYRRSVKNLFERCAKEKTVIFLTVSDTDRSMDELVSLFYTQALQQLTKTADNSKGRHLKHPVRMYLDDFATNTKIENFDRIISVIRSRGIAVSLMIQSIAQLESLYGSSKAVTITGNCDTKLLLSVQDDVTADVFSRYVNKSPFTLLTTPVNTAYLLVRGRMPRTVSKYDVSFDTLMSKDYEA